jgi:5-methylcytosine-specific restriction endonuclease McrA
MSRDVLILNRNFYAIHVTDWQRALTLVYLEHALVVDEEYRTYNFDDWRTWSDLATRDPSNYISTPTFRIAIPDVIVLTTYDKVPEAEVKFTRQNIYEHYGHQCVYCGGKFHPKDLNLEHVVPRSRGGPSTWANIVSSCVSCNLKKGDKMPEEAGMKLLMKPSKPQWKGVQSILTPSLPMEKPVWQRFIESSEAKAAAV